MVENIPIHDRSGQNKFMSNPVMKSRGIDEFLGIAWTKGSGLPSKKYFSRLNFHNLFTLEAS